MCKNTILLRLEQINKELSELPHNPQDKRVKKLLAKKKELGKQLKEVITYDT